MATMEQRVSSVEQAIVLLTTTLANMDKRLEGVETRLGRIEQLLEQADRNAERRHAGLLEALKRAESS